MRLSFYLIRQGVLILGIAAGGITTGGIAIAETRGNKRPQLEYFSVDVAPKIAGFDAKHIVSDHPITQNAWYQMDTTARVVVPSGAEAYLFVPENGNNEYRGYKIVGRKPIGKPLTAQLFLLRRDPNMPRESVLARFTFDVGAKQKTPGSRRDFLHAKGHHFKRLWSEQMAGSSMFRHLATSALKKTGEPAVSTGPNWAMRRSNIDDTIRLMSGGRAVSENLQLDRQLATSGDEGTLKSLSEVRGITVREIDWTDRLRDEKTALDPLADKIPHDQYAVFLPSFESLAKMLQHGNRLARPAVQWFEPQSRVTDVLGFYQQQLGLPLNALTRHFGEALIDEVALTGSDPYFRTGTDLAVLMQTGQSKLLHQAITTQVAALAAGATGVAKTQHTVLGHEVTEWSSKDRRFCSFVGVLGDVVVVANSRIQIEAILRCADQDQPSLGGLDEYRFFRQRYPRHAEDESALVIISDATIRRWCGPVWRIAASRRTRARATIAEMTMRNADALIHRSIEKPLTLTATGSMPDAGKLWLTASGVRSEKYGTLDFQTPIVELNLQSATPQEIRLYEKWRTQYERQWRVFDPIALKVSLQEDSLSADLSVIPLTLQTRYRSWLEIVGKASLKPGTSDAHSGTLASLDVAVDLDSKPFSFARSFLNRQGGKADLLSWIDGSVSIHWDHDEDWENRMAKRSPFRLGGNDMIRELPIGIFIPSKNSFRMTAFVVAVRATIDRFAPNMIRWDQLEYRDVNYVVATTTEGTPLGNEDDMPRVYYVTTPDGLSLSLNENVIQHAIDRHLARKAKRQQEKDAGKPVVTAEGDNEPQIDDPREHTVRPQIAVRLTGQGASTLAMTNGEGVRRMSRLAWSNLPILNYLRHRYPKQDPLDVYQQLLGEKLIDPGSGEYKWVDRFQTYESTHYGHHLAPKPGPPIGPALGPHDAMETTLSFQDGGLRATVKLTPSK